MAGEMIRDGVVLTRDGKIEQVGPASEVRIPSGYKLLRARVDIDAMLAPGPITNLPR